MKVRGFLSPKFCTKIECDEQSDIDMNYFIYSFGYRSHKIKSNGNIYIVTKVDKIQDYFTKFVLIFIILGGVFFWGDSDGIGFSLTAGGVLFAFITAFLSFVLGKRQHLVVLSRLRIHSA